MSLGLARGRPTNPARDTGCSEHNYSIISDGRCRVQVCWAAADDSELRRVAVDFSYLRKIVDDGIFCSYVISVITWDETKRATNLAKHGLDFADVIQFDFDTALHDFDDREEYGEVREFAIGWCGMRLCFLVFVRRGGDEIRVISFRRATRPEMRRYAKS